MKKILTICNAIIAALLSLTGCTFDIQSPAEYGTPSADFVVRGKVSSDAGQPAPNVAVVMRKQLGTDDDGRPQFYKVDSAGTDSNGSYRVKEQGAFPEDQAYRLTFSDVDGSANGALKDTTVTVEFTNPKFTGGDGSWSRGEAEREVNIQLRPEE
jgi:putative lipoprotein (rSAM/lipoprotein system)